MERKITPEIVTEDMSIVGVAIKGSNGTVYALVTENDKGYGHHHLIQSARYNDVPYIKPVTDDRQGFIDMCGNFYTREEALLIARALGQIRYTEYERDWGLLSEALWKWFSDLEVEENWKRFTQ